MAMEWVPNELALEYKDVSIYHIYKDDDNNAGIHVFSYGLDEYGSDDGTNEDGKHVVFDIRDLPSYDSNLSIEDNLRKAIDNGEITQDYVKTED